MSKVCDGLRGDAFVAAQEVGFDNLCEIVDGRPCAIDTPIQHMRGMVFPLTEHESKELFRQCCRLGGPCPDKMERVLNSLSRDDNVAGHSWFSSTSNSSP